MLIIGVRHHGGFDIVAQILNLSPYRPSLIKLRDYPTWIEDEQIERKMKDDKISTKEMHEQLLIKNNGLQIKNGDQNTTEMKVSDIEEDEYDSETDFDENEDDEYSDDEEIAIAMKGEKIPSVSSNESEEGLLGYAPSAPHRHAIPEYLNINRVMKNIQGRNLSRKDRKRIIHQIYRTLNQNLYANDKEMREVIQADWKEYKNKLRDDIIREEYDIGLNADMGYELIPDRRFDRSVADKRLTTKEGRLQRIPFQESLRDTFDHKLYSVGEKHILLERKTHISDEEKAYLKKEKEKGIRGKIRSFGSKLNPKNLKNISFKRNKK